MSCVAATSCAATSAAGGSSATMCTVMATRPVPNAHTCRSWMLATPGMAASWLASAGMLTEVGTELRRVRAAVRMMPKVVNSTRMENRKVQMGSATCARGSAQMMMAAIMTPTDCTRSPTAWMNAARTLMLPSPWLCPCPPSPPPWLCPWPWCRMRIMARFTTTPAAAVTNMIMPSTSCGVMMRSTAS